MRDKAPVDAPLVWVVPQAGFCWMEAENSPLEPVKGSGRFLIPRFSELGRHYSPLRVTGLFRSFAEIDPTEAGILLFANEFGCLGEPTLVVTKSIPEFPVRAFGGKAASPTQVLQGEGFHFWRQQISLMRRCLFLWDAVTRRRIADLKPVVLWDADSIRIVVDNHFQLIAAPHHYPGRLELIRRGDLFVPALYFVQEVVNEQLRQHDVAPQLLWNGSKLEQFMFPGSLIGALWAQFSAAVDGDRRYRRCEECRRWFERGGEVRADAKFCSNACRQRKKRKRQSEARVLAAKGLSISTIAKKLDTTSTTVQGWLS